jgi:hypothetical protein
MSLFNTKTGHINTVKQLNDLFDLPQGVAGSGLTATQSVVVPQYFTVPFSAFSVAMTDATTAGCHGSKQIFTMPAGNIMIIGAVAALSIVRAGTNITATAAVVSSVGTTAVSNADATLTGTEANIMASTAATLTAGAGAVNGHSTATVKLDGTDTAVPVFLNFAIPDAGSAGNDALTVTGTIRITYINAGDN